MMAIREEGGVIRGVEEGGGWRNLHVAPFEQYPLVQKEQFRVSSIASVQCLN